MPSLGLAYICEGLKEQRKGLVTLVLWNNQLTHTGMAFLGMALVSPGLFIGLVLPAHACLSTLLCVCVFQCVCGGQRTP